MIISISQPAYIPWLGYFDRIAMSDVAIVLDSVMLERSSKTRFTNRNKIRTENGWSWLTIPVKTSGLCQPVIRDVIIDNEQRWRVKHWKTIQQMYSRSPFFSHYDQSFESFYNKEWENLSVALSEMTTYLLSILGIKTKILYSSQLGIGGEKAELILNLCKALNAKEYISGPFGRDYLNLFDFDRAGIKVRFHDYPHPQYKQAYPGFEPYMSVIDLLFNHGLKSLDILRS
jgi:hypothetical protein